MSTALQKLDFMVSLIDKVSGPAGKIMSNMDKVTTSIQSGYQKIGYGTAGIVSAGFALDRLIAPTKELDTALRTVQSLDVVDSVLSDLTKTSLKFSMQYGESAALFVGASYDIQSAISGLVGTELAKFTETSAILAKGTKADTATITNYVGTMYGIFKNSADQMGKGQWVEMLAGQTAAAVQVFKTTGAEMSSSFTTVGAAATSHGIAMNEQIAILGTLQATMSGSEAGTRYKAFLDGVGKSQDVLGLRFTDSQGKMLPMIDIMSKIQGKFGDLSTVADSDMLKKAFGSKEAVDLIKLLSNDVDGLNNSIGLIGQQKGMDKAIQMAQAMKDPFEVAGQQFKAIQIVFGKAMMPALLPFLSSMGDGANTLLRWTELFPNLTKMVGIGVLAIIALIAGFSALSIIVGISKFVMVGWSVVMGTLKLAILATKFSLMTLIPTVYAFGAALLTNPITWIVIGIAALVAVVIAAIVYWDEWTGSVINFASGFLEMLGVFGVVDSVLATWEKLPSWWANFKNWLSTLDPFAFVGDSIDWLIDKINLIPGIDIGSGPVAPKPIAAPASMQPNNQRRGGPNGGVLNQISNANANNSRQFGDIIIQNQGQAMNGQAFMDELAFSAG